ncbi:MAG TPA: alpha/beta hydrolase [Thermoleophilaceae bacterium]|nr:alpha/beta hydrolase [Thermoleophilaceae bacterium]
MEREIELPQGTIRVYEEGEGPVLLFVHGLLVSHTLWELVVKRLADRHRCVSIDLPLGAHRVPMKPDADISPIGIAGMIAGVMDELDLRDVVLVGNDTGGAICQLVVAHHPERLAGLVLTTCDAYEHFPPPALKPLLWLPRSRRIGDAFLRLGKLPPVRDALIAPVNKRRSKERSKAWVEPLSSDAGVRRDVLRFIERLDNADTVAAAPALKSFDRPALVVWTRGDRFFPMDDGRRLATDLSAPLVVLDDTRTFIPLDQPEQLAELIGSFVAEQVSVH